MINIPIHKLELALFVVLEANDIIGVHAVKIIEDILDVATHIPKALTIKVVSITDNEMPTYATEGSVGLDLKASLKGYQNADYEGSKFQIVGGQHNIPREVIIFPQGRVAIPTGLKMEIPKGYAGEVRPKSGLALKKGLGVLNSPGTIDSDYRGEIKVILYNTGDSKLVINHGDEIAQLVFSKVEVVNLQRVIKLSDTERGAGGFGSTSEKHAHL